MGSLSGVLLKSPMTRLGADPASSRQRDSISLADSRRATVPSWSKWALKTKKLPAAGLLRSRSSTQLAMRWQQRPSQPLEGRSGVSLSQKWP